MITRDLRIVAAAVLCDGRIYRARNHSYAMHQIWDEELAAGQELTKITQDMQGFVDQYGQFWNRFQAGAIALRAGQTKFRHEQLNSEHLPADYFEEL